jgi:hypothetical protein
MIYAVIVGHLYPYTFSIVGLITSACLIFIGLMMIHITPQVRDKLFLYFNYRDNRVHTQRTLQQRLTVPASTTRAHNATTQQITKYGETNCSIIKQASHIVHVVVRLLLTLSVRKIYFLICIVF